jgi:hypothetical protein
MHIKNLTPLQKTICDSLWQCETEDKVKEYIESLPSQLHCLAFSLRELMLLEYLDELVAHEADCGLAKQILKSF